MLGMIQLDVGKANYRVKVITSSSTREEVILNQDIIVIINV